MKYLRNPDITLEDRTIIGLKSIQGNGVYGTVTNIAKQFNVSRPFIYTTKNTIINSLSLVQSPENDEKKEKIDLVNSLILTMRLSCKSSIEGISESLKLLNLPNNSFGYISEYLNSKSTCIIENLPVQKVAKTVMADEIFACNQPILVILDAHSHLILAIELANDRTGETWNKCFNTLISKGYEIKKVAKDMGTGLQKGIEGLDIIAQADLFHLLMKFDPPIGTYERKAFGSIEEEERTLKVFNNRKSEVAGIKAIEKHIDSVIEAEKRITCYDNFDYLHRELHEAFNPFNWNGTFRPEEIIRSDVFTVLDLMYEEFGDNKKVTDACDFLRKHIAQYTPYIKDVEKVLNTIYNKLPDYQVSEVCLSYLKNLKSIAVKHYWAAKKLKNEADGHLSLALDVSNTEYEKELVSVLLNRLNKCIRSSSPLEAKNSILRKYINSLSGQITQTHLNLISFYMNRKVSIRGKYKGFSPIERETGRKEEETFLDILLNVG